VSSIRDSPRRGVVLSDPLVTRAPMFDGAGEPPLVFTPARADIDLADWVAGHADDVHKELLRFGALLFRGFSITDAGRFERAARALASNDLFGEYGDLPRQSASDKIFHSTPYPDSLAIHFHNESSHMSSWPRHIFFHCAVAAREGGGTPVVDCRAVYRELDRDVIAEFEGKGLTYIRNFSEGIDVPWQSFFGTASRTEVEARCVAAHTRYQWVDGDGLRISQDAAAVRVHPATGDRVFFNQVLLHHPAALPATTRRALLDLYTEESLPRLVAFGDGSAIPDDVVAYLIASYEARAVRYPWHQGDIMVLDNMLVSHGRDPFVGPRTILVAMSDMVDAA
jgi:alpha-ketoglutarate-dependent taurine dioxygenase